eukprot:4793258-Amphidinium_carterae.1
MPAPRQSKHKSFPLKVMPKALAITRLVAPQCTQLRYFRYVHGLRMNACGTPIVESSLVLLISLGLELTVTM